MKYPALSGLILLALLASPSSRAQDTDAQIRSAIVGLMSSDPAKRDKAAQELIRIGAPARPMVFEASRSDSPELRAQAAQVLLKLPWFLPDDSPAVRDLLANYGRLDVEKRQQIVAQLADLRAHGFDALARLVQEEPSDDVKWTIVNAVRLTYWPNALESFQKIDTEPDSAPLLAAAGHAWLTKEVPRGRKLLERAAKAALDQPANDGGEIDWVFHRLNLLALLDGRFDDATRLLRMQAGRAVASPTDDADAPSAVVELFALHATHGPLDGFMKDLLAHEKELADPRIMFSLAKVCERSGNPALAQGIARGAFLCDVISIPDRFAQGSFLLKHGWRDLAQAQFAAVLDHAGEPNNNSGQPVEFDQANAYFRLASVSNAREDDFETAQQMQQAMELHYKVRGDLRGTTDQAMWQEINWHYLRAARQRGDMAEVKKRIPDLMNGPLSNPDIANDLVPLLKDLGRPDDAKQVFKRAYDQLQEQLGDRSDHPMPKNNLAWLCARCGENKAEALQWATQATTAMPDNAAFLDTLAEANYQLSYYEKAVEIETRVLRARPNDVFLTRQLQRFRQGPAAKR